MEWPQFTTMEHLLASKQGNYGTLSIVVRPSSSAVSRSRVNLAAVGLAPLEGGGNAAIVHEFEGHIHAYHTSAEHPYDLGFSNRVPGEGLPVVRSLKLDESRMERLNEAMFAIQDRVAAGACLWTPLRTSAAFAANVWEATFDEKLDHRSFGLSTTDNLARSILEFGHRERSFLRGEREALDLLVSERILELTSKHDVQERAEQRGMRI